MDNGLTPGSTIEVLERNPIAEAIYSEPAFRAAITWSQGGREDPSCVRKNGGQNQ